MKTCIECKETKPESVEYFSKNTVKPDGRIIFRTRCRPCLKKYFQEYRKKKPKSKVYLKKYYQEHKEIIKEQTRKNRKIKDKELMKEVLTLFVKEQQEKINKL